MTIYNGESGCIWLFTKHAAATDVGRFDGGVAITMPISQGSVPFVDDHTDPLDAVHSSARWAVYPSVEGM